MAEFVNINETPLPVLRFDAVVIGSGAAGYAAAERLAAGGLQVAVVTEHRRGGTSRNAGSDKQTYYKLSMAGGKSDSVEQMARDLFAGGGMNGDTALCEAANSARCFWHLAELGVPFVMGEYGEAVSYKTDHDQCSRATSAGPLTSKMMTEALEQSAIDNGVTVIDHMMAVRLAVSGGRVHGVLAMDTAAQAVHLIASSSVVLCTGGPAGIYRDSVFPESQSGMTGMALLAGARAFNLNEWQYGIASTKFRWNLSGTYQQVLPRYFSVDEAGIQHDFLAEHFNNAAEMLHMIFLKGYEWPFDVRKLGGSSVIDSLVYEQTRMGRRVFLDFRANHAGFVFDLLHPEAKTYLLNSGAAQATPIERLAHMNQKAIDVYANAGIDLYNEALEIAVCAQHNNGGIDVDTNWQSSISGLYAAGEAAGTFGIYRPGGSALNSGQVGALHLAAHIMKTGRPVPDIAACKEEAAHLLQELDGALQGTNTAAHLHLQLRGKMSDCCAHIRDPQKLKEVHAWLAENEAQLHISDISQAAAYFKAKDCFVAAKAVVSAMITACDFGSRGSAIVCGNEITDSGHLGVVTQQSGDEFVSAVSQVRPIPEREEWFETLYNK